MTDVESIFEPSVLDVEYPSISYLKIGLILRLDSYKFAHPFAYSTKDKICGMFSYGEARVSSDTPIVPFGLKLFINRYLTQQITMADVDAAEAFSVAHFGAKLFARPTWERIVRECNGYLPVIIRAVPEGTVIGGGMPIYSVTAFGEDRFWLSSAIETMLQRAVWYPTSVASNDYSIMRAFKQFYEDTGADMSMLPFALHDFGGRGVTCAEQAEIGGAAHLVNFMGSDTVEGILTANHYYHHDMAAFSVYATEHSVECSFGKSPEEEIEYLRHQLRTAKSLGLKIVSIVIDGYDVMRAARALCTDLKDEIIASGVKVVFRPDSGDMMEIVPKILRMQEIAFGYTLTSKGFRKINYVGIIQGDGVDHLAIKSLLGKLLSYGWSADNVIFGSGGALLQKVNRDTYKTAQKAASLYIRGAHGMYWKGISKDPITDPGKRSKEGVITLVRDKNTGKMSYFRLDTEKLPEHLEDMHKLVYHCGKLYNDTTLNEVRERAAA